MTDDAVILLVEDRADDVIIILRAFTQAQLDNKVIVARDGEEALQYLGGQGEFADRHRFPLPHLILLDLKMPKVDGFEVLAWLKDKPALRNIPVVVLTLSSDIRDVNQAYQLGAHSFMVKPEDFYNVTAMAQLLRDLWLMGNKVPGQLRGSLLSPPGDKENPPKSV